LFLSSLLIEVCQDAVDENNKKFIAMMHPELGILLDETPPSEPSSRGLGQGATAADKEGSNWSMSVD
jgi:hypothetical protein